MKARHSILIALAIGVTLLLLSLASEIAAGFVQRFQTLIAALVAGVAATLAYEGAMLKVEFDREHSRRSEAGNRLALLLRLDLTLSYLAYQADKIVERVGSLKPLKASDTKFDIPRELDDAWANLHQFSPVAANALAMLRLQLNTVNFNTIPDDREINDDGIREQFRSYFTAIRDDTKGVRQEIKTRIIDIREEFPEL